MDLLEYDVRSATPAPTFPHELTNTRLNPMRASTEDLVSLVGVLCEMALGAASLGHWIAVADIYAHRRVQVIRMPPIRC
jgi:hypothetical protein